MMSPVEEFILKQVFEWEDDPEVVGAIYFFATEEPSWLLRNKQELPYISFVQVRTCGRMRPDAISGVSILIMPDSIESVNTTTWLEKRIADLNLNGRRGEA
jgi:hypothetical protein